MKQTMRPLWQLLMDGPERLNCDECFLVLENLADIAVENGDSEALRKTAAEHIAGCSRCRQHNLARLAALEQPPGWQKKNPPAK